MQRRIEGLDGLRGLSAIAVVFCHCVAGTTQMGGVAVDVFFALSGFLLVKVLHDGRLGIERREKSFFMQLKDFWGRRAARIVPAYFVVATVSLTAFVTMKQVSWPAVLAFATYTQNFYLGALGHFLPFGHTWTLAVEQQFYVLFAPLLLIVPSRWHRALLLALWLGLMSLILALLWRATDSFALFMSPLTGFALAAAGGLFAIETQDARLRLLTRGELALPVFIILTAVMVVPSSFSDTHTRFNIVQTAFLIVCIPSLVAFVARHPKSLATQFLESRTLKFYGSISYSLYLIHGSLIEVIKPNWPTAPGPRWFAFPLSRLSLFAAMIAISTVLATLSFNLIERRFLHRRPVLLRGAGAPIAVKA